MAIVVSLEEFRPVARYDGVPFTQARIEEAAVAAGPFTLLETFPLVPPDADPSDPASRSFTTNLATLEEGWYRVVFVDANADSVTVGPIHNISVEPSYLPVVSDIGALLRARTKDNLGNELGTFTDETRPTDEQVIRLIKLADGDVAVMLPDNLPEEYYEELHALVALRAAMLVELTHFPEQVRTGRSAYAEYERMFDTQMEALKLELEVEPPPVDGATQNQTFLTFPDYPTAGWTRW